MNHDVSGAGVEQVEIGSIRLGQRRRKKLGSLRSLAKSIDRHGLIHPVLVRDGNELVSGQRRLEACKSLGWRLIPVRHVESLSDDELRAIELDENAERLALADFESSKDRLAQIRQAEAESKERETCFQEKQVSGKAGKRGPKRKPGSKRDVAQATGISPKAQIQTERHVALATRFPFMQGPDWNQGLVLAAGKSLDSIPEPEHPKVAALVDQFGIGPKKVVEILKHVAEMPVRDRKKMFALAESDDPHDRETALTIAAAVPPPPDPALNRLRTARDELAKAAEVCVAETFLPRIRSARDNVISLEKDFTAFQRSCNGKQG